MNNEEMDAARIEIHNALVNSPIGDEGFLTSTTILTMTLAYILYSKQEIERLADANPDVDASDPAPYKKIFDTVTDELIPRGDPELAATIRTNTARYIRAFGLDHPGETEKQLVEILTRFYDNEGSGQFQIIVEPTRTPERLLSARYIPMLNAELINILFNLDIKNDFVEDPLTKVATRERDDQKITIEGYDMIESFSSSPLKLLDAILSYLTFDNYVDNEGPRENLRTVVEIPLYEYAEIRDVSIEPRELDDPEAQKRERRNAAKRKSTFISDIERDLDTLARFRVTGKMTKGPRKNEYIKLVLVGANHAVVNDYIRVPVPEDTARYLLESNLLMQYAPQLQRLNDSNPNTYRIGRKLLLHNSMYSNRAAKTANTLKVATLIASTPFIPDWETLRARGSRNWKQKIKQPLETVFERLEEIGFLISWQYRDPRTKKIYSQKQAGYLTPDSYEALMFDFKLIDNPEGDQQHRRHNAKKQAITEKNAEK